jgi:hypothetical protein
MGKVNHNVTRCTKVATPTCSVMSAGSKLCEFVDSEGTTKNLHETS